MYANDTEQLSHRALQDRLGASFPRGNPPAYSGFTNVDTAPPKPTFDELKQRKRSEINQSYHAELSPVIDGYPEIERLTWIMQESEARGVGNRPTPFLDALSVSEGRDRTQVAADIIARADAWIQLSATATGKRHKLQDAIDTATTVEDLDLITW